jgi:hypothetical protein
MAGEYAEPGEGAGRRRHPTRREASAAAQQRSARPEDER